MRFNKLFLIVLLVAQLLIAREQVEVNFSNLKINDFIKLVANITNKNIMYSHQIDGTVNFITTTPIYNDELLGILISFLETKGLTIIENGSFYEIVRSSEAAMNNLRVIRPGAKTSGSIMVTQAITVKSENVDIIVAKVRHLISKTAKLITLKKTNTLLITDYPKNIETIKKVINNIDRDNKIVMQVVPILYAKSKELHTQINELAKVLFDESIQSEKVKILLNTDINGLVLAGKQKNINILIRAIKELDKEQNLDETVQIFSLKNSDAKNVLASLIEIATKQTFSDPSMNPKISANEEINAIIIIGSPLIIKGLKLIIDELDKEKYQVYVQARIIEINKDESEKIGLKYGLEGGITNSSSLYTLAADFGAPAVATSEIFSAKLISSLGNIDNILAIGATLDFLQANGASQTISNPSVLCVNNKESSIYVGKTLSFQTGEASNSAGGTTNAFQREDIGLTLKIKPRVSSKDKVTLDIETILENIIPVTDTNGQPVTTKQPVTTQAILRHGESIIIGGLVKIYDTDVQTKLPLLGYIPVVGSLFTHSEIKKQEDHLIVILTPYVINKSEELSNLQKQLGEFGRLQRKYNELIFPIVEEKAIQKEPTSKNPLEDLEQDY